MIVDVVTFKTALTEAEVCETIDARMLLYRELPGLLQKLYLGDPATRRYGGIYVWDTPEARASFRDSPLARSIADAYQVRGRPKIDSFDLMGVLRAPESAPVAR